VPWNLSDKRDFKRELAITLGLLLSSIVWISYTIASTVYKVHKVNRWLPKKCVIDSIYIDTDHTSEPAVFFWNIQYCYEYNGQKYTSNRHNILKKHKALTKEEEDRQSKGRMKHGYTYEVQGPFSQGDETTCFVNPRNPSEAILSREYKYRSVLKRLLPPVILLLGSLAILYKFVQTFHC
jgi:hypothetical protein